MRSRCKRVAQGSTDGAGSALTSPPPLDIAISKPQHATQPLLDVLRNAVSELVGSWFNG